MGGCCAKPAARAEPAAPAPKEGVVKKMRRASAAMGRRASAALGMGHGAPKDDSATAPRQKLDPSKNVSQLIDGTWRAHDQPDRPAMLKASHLPFIIRKILLSLGDPPIDLRAVDNGLKCWFLGHEGVSVLDDCRREDKKAFGIKIHSEVTIRRGPGGSLEKVEDVILGKVRHHTLTKSTFEIEGGRVYMHDAIEYQYEREPLRNFRRTTIRLHPEAPTPEDQELYRTYKRLVAAEAAGPANGASIDEVELSIVDGDGAAAASPTPYAQKKNGAAPKKSNKKRRDSRLDYGKSGEGHGALNDNAQKRKKRRDSRLDYGAAGQGHQALGS